tara:strand:- start:3878 stop:4147 length:270 start_codon:yes stop_codon:yes gene_type:complete
MPLSTEKKKEIINKFGKNKDDSGSTEAQIALLTQRVRDVTAHVNNHAKDNHSRHGLVNLVSQRRRLMKYLQRTNPESYVELTNKLKIRK